MRENSPGRKTGYGNEEKAEQIVTLLRQIEAELANRKTTPQDCTEAEITVQTYHRWRKEYGGLKLAGEASETAGEGTHKAEALCCVESGRGVLCPSLGGANPMTGGIKSIVLGLMVFVLLAGCAALAYARWTRPVTEADAALAAGQFDRALADYAAAEARFDQAPPIKQLFASEYSRIVANQLWLLYRLGRYDDTIDKAERAPEGAMPHFWAGLALYHKGDAERKPEARQQWLNSAQQELHRAVEAAPEDWDTKYNFELVARLQKTMSAHPKESATQPLNLLRPEPPKSKPVKIGG